MGRSARAVGIFGAWMCLVYSDQPALSLKRMCHMQGWLLPNIDGLQAVAVSSLHTMSYWLVDRISQFMDSIELPTIMGSYYHPNFHNNSPIQPINNPRISPIKNGSTNQGRTLSLSDEVGPRVGHLQPADGRLQHVITRIYGSHNL